MGLASLSYEAVPSQTLTPQEPLVEALRVALSQNSIFVLTQPQDKTFLFTWLVKAFACYIRDGSGSVCILVENEAQANLWKQFFLRTTDLLPTTQFPQDSATAFAIFNKPHLKSMSRQNLLEKFDGLNVLLFIIDNGHSLLTESPEDCGNLRALVSRFTTCQKNDPIGRRIVTFTSNVLGNNGDHGLKFIDHKFDELERLYSADVEAGCELLSLLRFIVDPAISIVKYVALPRPPDLLESSIESIVLNCIDFLNDHQYSLFEIYGSAYSDLIDGIPNPMELPLDLLTDFLTVLRTLGVWCAERAALALVVRIEKLKTREKYERHYLILGALYSQMLRITHICQESLSNVTEKEKLIKYSKPKLRRLAEILKQYKPDHVGTSCATAAKGHSKTRHKSNSEKKTLKVKAVDVLEEDEINESNVESRAEVVEKPPSDLTVDSETKGTTGSRDRPHKRHPHRGKSTYSSYDDPNALCGAVFVNNKFVARILYHFLKELARNEVDFSFLTPQYAIGGLKGQVQESAAAGYGGDDGDRRKQEEALRRFRMRECNLLISDSELEVGVDGVRCNLVVAFDAPKCFRSYLQYKVKAKATPAWFVILSENCQDEEDQLVERLALYKVLENKLKSKCALQASDEHPLVAGNQGHTVTGFRDSVLHLNRYCAKLPSDTFTRLTPLYSFHKVGSKYICTIQLPINSPLKDVVCGSEMSTRALSMRSAALTVCLELQKLKELDEHMNPVGKDLGGSQYRRHQPPPPPPPPPLQNNNDDKDASGRHGETGRDQEGGGGRSGTTKRRQYYYKQVSRCLCRPKECDDDHRHQLYSLHIKLSCAIPEDQNTRGRKIFAPEDADQRFGILVRHEIPPVSEFPIYTRSGEVFVSTRLLEKDVELTNDERELILTFHDYTFDKVLRLVKYPMLLSLDEAENSVLVVPLRASNDKIDWKFLNTIETQAGLSIRRMDDKDREGFRFDEDVYKDAVLTPWYRNQDQPQYFYVAEICQHLSPTSDFPGQGFETFEKYYRSKYQIDIQNLEQPLLDVDHTSARLNFLTPRYVNRKGVALPTSSDETKKNKRENLDQKQILVPELCTVHPFPASFWRQAVCLPCILYRLNGLLLANQLRSLVALEATLGLQEVDKTFKWPPLTFGWTLSDVLKNRSSLSAKPDKLQQPVSKGRGKCEVASSTEASRLRALRPEADGCNDEMGSLTNKLLSKLNEEESKLKKNTSLEIGTWSNDMMKNAKSVASLEDEFEEMDMLDPNVALPDNLTFLDSSVLPMGGKGGTDWGTGIAQRFFRVGSPTFFSNPNINIPGLMNDSCSDISDDNDGEETLALTRDGEDLGGVRIEFHGDNIAEAIEDELQKKKRVENIAKDLEAVSTMVQVSPWQWNDVESECLFGEEIDRARRAFQNQRAFILKSEDSFNKEDLATSSTFDQQSNGISPLAEDESRLAAGDVFRKTVCSRFQDQLTRSDGCKSSVPAAAAAAAAIRISGFGSVPLETKLSFSFDFQPDLDGHAGPSPSLILQSLTMSNSNDAINLERLETIGDSFLKYATTSYLFCVNSSVHEGRLSHLRSKYVSNLNLYRLGKRKSLGQFMIATKFEPHDNWLPPCYHVPREIELALIQSGVPSTHWNMAELPNLRELNCEQICSLLREKSGGSGGSGGVGGGGHSSRPKNDDKIPSFVPYNLLTQHSIPDKSIADCVEALIGAYLIACGAKAALLLMRWMGLDLLAKGENVIAAKNLFPIPPSPLMRIVPNPEQQLNVLLDGYEQFEDLIGYKFRDRSYLLQAFSHASYYPNRLTDCYQRLEFLGDAVLDYLITRHLFEDEKQHSPGALTDLRSALVNNTIFASLAVKYNFHKYFKHFSPGLHQVINRFVNLQKNGEEVLTEDFYLVDEDDPEEAEDIEVPKALGDIFESVAGAIYLDSDLQLDPVWTVYYRMMRKEIDVYSNNVPKSPIRELLELEPETARFGKPEKLADGRRVRVTVEVFGKGVFKGIGRNYRIAKCTAAKCALRSIKKQSDK